MQKVLPQRRLQAAAGAGSRWQQAALVEALAMLEGVLGRLRDKAAKALAEEEIALAAFAEPSGKVVTWRCMQAVLKHEIDELYEDAEEEKDVARGFAEHEAREREYALLELQRARDPAWELMPQGGVGNLGWWKYVGGLSGGGGDGDVASDRRYFSGRRGDGGGGRCRWPCLQRAC